MEASDAASLPEAWEDVQSLLSDQQFDFIRKLAMDRAGIHLADYKRNMVYRRISRRFRALGFSTTDEYCALLTSQDGPDEIQGLVNALTTNKTEFFRESHHFDHLASTAVPESLRFLEHSRSRRLRIWSAGCSSGQEPYSLAMTLLHNVANIHHWDVRILATDIDTDVLAKASQGLVTADEIDLIPPLYRRKFIARAAGTTGQFRIADSIRDVVSFKPLNLHDSWPMQGPFDAIFCRNVVIYFDKATQCRLFDRFANILRTDSYIYLGHSESLYRVTNRFRSIGQSIHQKID